jgi:aspartate/methionine/tyrosine aminotransferase
LNLEKFNLNWSLEIKNSELKKYIEALLKNSRFDKRFCYYLLANTGVCTVPLSWFNSTYDGFRMTLLEDDIEKFKNTLETVKKALEEFS